MDNLETILCLGSFAPLIQLWAGICLLFFYCELLEDSPFNSIRTQLLELYKDVYSKLTTQFQVFVPDGYEIDFDDLQKKDEHWESFKSSIYCMAIFCFFYALIVLVIIGIEGNKDLGKYREALQVTNTLALVYYVLNTFFYRTFWGQSRFFAALCSILLGVYIPFHFFVSKHIYFGESWDGTSISVYTLITCIMGLMLILCHLLYDWYTIRKCKKRIDTVYKIFDMWTKMPFNVISEKDRWQLNWKSNWKSNWILTKNSIMNLLHNHKIEWDNSLGKIMVGELKHKVEKNLKFLRKKLQ